jgi:RNA polymerase sigma factor (sigma-70 family)
MNNLEGVRSGEREDATLVFALRAGERWAPKAILDRYSDRVSRFFARSTGRRLHDLEDLTQDVFLRVFACRAIQKPGSLRHFIMSVAARVLSRQIRYQQIRRSVCLSATGDVPEIATPPRDDEARYTLRRCYEILERIRSRERAAFVLRYLEGMSLEEVAGQLNVSISTAKRLIRRAANKISTRVARTPTAEIAHTD